MHERIGVGTEHAAGHIVAADVIISRGGFQETRCRTGECRFAFGESRLVPSDTDRLLVPWERTRRAASPPAGAVGSSARVTPNGLWDRLRVGHEHGHDGHRSHSPIGRHVPEAGPNVLADYANGRPSPEQTCPQC